MKILLLRFSSIGDIVLTTPVIRCLKRQSGADLHILTKAAFAGIMADNPYVDRVWIFQKKVSEVLPALKQERFDWVIDLHGNLRSLTVKMSLRRPSRAFDKLNFKKWLLVNARLNYLPDIHIVHRYMNAVRHLGIRYDGEGLDYFIPPDQEVDIPTVFPGMAAGAFTAFVLGATHETKRLPLHKMEEILRQINGPVVLLGGKSEAALGARLAAGTQRVADACGILSLHQSASVLRQSARVLTHDTGLMHIAAALRKEIVSVWGNTVPAFGMYPFYPHDFRPADVFEVLDLPCRPCSKIGFARCPKGHFACMENQDAARIAEAVNR